MALWRVCGAVYLKLLLIYKPLMQPNMTRLPDKKRSSDDILQLYSLNRPPPNSESSTTCSLPRTPLPGYSKKDSTSPKGGARVKIGASTVGEGSGSLGLRALECKGAWDPKGSIEGTSHSWRAVQCLVWGLEFKGSSLECIYLSFVLSCIFLVYVKKYIYIYTYIYIVVCVCMCVCVCACVHFLAFGCSLFFEKYGRCRGPGKLRQGRR